MSPESNGFFTPAANTKPFLKVGFEGFAGSGKTYTMVQLAIELHRQIGSKKPVAMIDTEKASRFVMPLFERAGIQLYVKESRALADLVEAMRVCEDGFADILLNDSVSHQWENFLEAYKKKVNRDRLQFEDWGRIKPTWKREFSDRFVQSKLHILFTGRAGYEYMDEKDPETGKRQIYKSGIKMKVEGETAYEPDLLLLMERYEIVLEGQGSQGKEVWREATVLKDRSGVLPVTIRNPTGKDFAPVIEYLLANPAAAEPAPHEGDDASLFVTTEEGEKRKLERQILLEEIEAALVSAAPGQTAKEKKWKGDALDAAFGTRSWKAVEVSGLDRLRFGREKVVALARRFQALRAEAELNGAEAEVPTLAQMAAELEALAIERSEQARLPALPPQESLIQ